jgi:hypothetical protein
MLIRGPRAVVHGSCTAGGGFRSRALRGPLGPAANVTAGASGTEVLRSAIVLRVDLRCGGARGRLTIPEPDELDVDVSQKMFVLGVNGTLTVRLFRLLRDSALSMSGYF